MLVRMNRILSFIIVLIPLVLNSQDIDFDKFFEDKTLNLEVYHSGRYALEYYSIDNSYISGSWAGTRTKLIDKTNYGVHKVEVFESQTNKMIYSRNYCSLFEEWSTTSQGRNSCGNFEEVLRIPFPKEEVIIKISSKDSVGVWKEIMKTKYSKSLLGYSNMKKEYKPIKLHYSGEINKKLDIVILPSGYSIEDSLKMRDDLKLFSEFIFSKNPFSNMRDKINVWAVEYFSEESGIPGLKNSKINQDTELGVSYNTFGSPRYIMSEKLFNIHSVLRNTPYEQIIIMCNSDVYGGGGIYNFYATSYFNKDNSFVIVHEFGHSFAALGDEYAENDSEMQGAFEYAEPWQANITSLKEFKNKWEDMIEASTPIPTPKTPEYKDKVGVFEGAAYMSKGFYRPYQDCLMRSDKPFCPVCVREINKMIDFYTE